MRITAVSAYVPYVGIRHAGGEYLLRHLNELHAHGHQVSLIIPGIPEERAKVSSAPDWLKVIVGPHVPGVRTTTQRVRDAIYRRAMDCPPAPAAEILRSIHVALKNNAGDADFLEIHWADYAHFASVLRRAGLLMPISVVEHDVGFGSPRPYWGGHRFEYRHLLGLLTTPLRRRREIRGLLDANVVLVFKREDERVLRRARVSTEVVVIDPWLDEPRAGGVGRRPLSVLFTGALWRPENEDGLLWFLARVWPQVHRAVAGATLTVVGAAPSSALQAEAGRAKGVEMIVDVPDMLPYYERASLFVAPLFVGGGLKFKIPQAMLCGLPVVATPTAVEGVAEVAPAHSLWGVTADPDQMAASVIAALSDPVRAAEVGAAAAAWCRMFYSFPASMARVLEAYERFATAP